MLVATQYLLNKMNYEDICVTASNLRISDQGEILGVNKWMITWMNGIIVNKRLKRFIAHLPPGDAGRTKRYYQDIQWDTPEEAYEFWKVYGNSIIAQFQKAEPDGRG